MAPDVGKFAKASALRPYKEPLGRSRNKAWDVFSNNHCPQGTFFIIDLTNEALMIFICLSIGQTVCRVPCTELGVRQTRERKHGARLSQGFWSGGEEGRSEK